MHPIIEIFGMKIGVFPLVLIVAIYSCIIVVVKLPKYDLFYYNWIKGSLLYSILGAGVMGKILYMITRVHEKNHSIYEMFGGFVFYGGFIGAIIGIIIFSIKKQARFLDLLDVYACVLPLGQAIGRLGCYFNGCCYGKEYYGILAVPYVVDGKHISVFPTWFMEAMICFLLFIVFNALSKDVYSGLYASMYMIIYSICRFAIEFYRGDRNRGIWLGVSTSQYISVLILFLGIGLLIISVKIKDKNLIILGRNENADECISANLQ